MTPRPGAGHVRLVRPSHAHEASVTADAPRHAADARAREEEGGVRTRRTTTGSTETV